MKLFDALLFAVAASAAVKLLIVAAEFLFSAGTPFTFVIGG